MLSRFATWPDVVQYVRSHRLLYLAPGDCMGLHPMVARVPCSGDGTRLYLRDAAPLIGPGYPPKVADATYLDKLYRWEVHKSDPT